MDLTTIHGPGRGRENGSRRILLADEDTVRNIMKDNYEVGRPSDLPYMTNDGLRFAKFRDLINIRDPEPVVTEEEGFFVLREDRVVGGLKMRFIYNLVEDDEETTDYIIRPSREGWFQIAFPICCYLLGKRVHMVFNENELNIYHRNKEISLFFQGIAHYIDKRKEDDLISEIKRQYPGAVTRKVEFEDVEDYINDSSRLFTLSQIYQPKRVWVTSTTGAIGRIARKIFPKARIMIVKISRWKFDLPDENSEIVEYGNDFHMPARIFPPYPSEATYDAKIWEMAKRYGEKGDFIINVAGL